MALQDVIVTLRQAEQQLEQQLASIRGALSSLESGSAATPERAAVGATNDRPVRKRSKLSAKGRAAISAAQKARWAKIRAANK
jgi:hypothetical protein